jgi:5-methylcytosine-specific restriction endonuclease McrA
MAQLALEKYEEDLAPKRNLKKNNEDEREEVKQQSRYINKQTKYNVYKNANGKCQLCGSTKNLQYDHLNPHAKGGNNKQSNLRLLCSNCNLRAGILEFGTRKMRRESGARATNEKISSGTNLV